MLLQDPPPLLNTSSLQINIPAILCVTTLPFLNVLSISTFEKIYYQATHPCFIISYFKGLSPYLILLLRQTNTLQ